MLTDYDFRLGKNHLRGKGRRGLIALAMKLTSSTATVGILAIPAKPAVFLGFELLKNLVGK
jgi:hypothetical protein